jgi:dTDP-4-dehydrorhamnose reductase
VADLLITGASGFLGAHLMLLSLESGIDAVGIVNRHEVPFDCRSVHLDLTDSRALMSFIQSEKPKAVIHTAAISAPDYCELHADEAERVNSTATGLLAMAAFAADAHFTFVSTDLVFDGRRGMYVEEDAPNPLNVYARTKAEAEHYVRAACRDFAVVRPSFLYGVPLADYHSSYSAQVETTLRSGRPLNVFHDQYRSPIPVASFAAACLEISSRRLGGLWHVAGPERVSRAEFARTLAEVAGLDSALLRETSMLDVALPAARPQDVSLNTSKATAVLQTPLPSVRDGLEALYH